MTKQQGKFTELSVDIESLGTKPGSIVLSVAAVPFDVDSGISVDLFYMRISVMDSLVNGLRADMPTLEWWGAQSAEAWDSLHRATEMRLRTVFESLNQYVNHHCDPKSRIWMKGPSFDGVLLSAAAEAARTQLPWQYWQERCVRTICDDVDPPKRSNEDTRHDALQDAIYQAKWVHTALLSKRVLESEKK